MTAPTKRQANRAIKDAIVYKRIPDDTDYMGFRYGTGYTADYGLYWSKRGLCARFRRRNDGSWYLTSTDEIDATSHMARTLVAWSPI